MKSCVHLAIGIIAFTMIAQRNAECAAQMFDENQPYCFRFTWLGPKYNNDSVFMDETCEKVIGARGTAPCIQPLVVTDNSNLPNTTWMWETHKANVSHIACRLTKSEVCVRIAYRFNHALENVTFMCSKVQIKDGGVVRSNCYTQYDNGRELEVCACESAAGQMPCNSAKHTSIFSTLLLTTVFGFVFWATCVQELFT